MILEVENTLIEALQNMFKEKTFETENGKKNIYVGKVFSSYENFNKENVDYPCILLKLDEDTHIFTKEKEDKSLKFHFFISTNISSKEKSYAEIIKIYEELKNEILKNGRIGNIIVGRRNIKGILLENENNPFIWMDMQLEIGNTILTTNLEEENFYV